MTSHEKAVVLLSGGLDSATVAAIAVQRGFSLHALTFNYGQKHDVEIRSAGKLAGFFRAESHVIIDIPSKIFSTALVKHSGIDVPKNRPYDADVIPSTYVPARNIIFLSFALACAESSGARHIFIGANAVDYSGYPDCRPEFFKAFQVMADAGTRAGVEGRGFIIETPLLNWTKAEIIRKGTELGVDYSMTHSCYDPGDDGTSCGGCDSCIIRSRGFAEAGIPDPTIYRKKS